MSHGQGAGTVIIHEFNCTLCCAPDASLSSSSHRRLLLFYFSGKKEYQLTKICRVTKETGTEEFSKDRKLLRVGRCAIDHHWRHVLSWSQSKDQLASVCGQLWPGTQVPGCVRAGQGLSWPGPWPPWAHTVALTAAYLRDSGYGDIICPVLPRHRSYPALPFSTSGNIRLTLYWLRIVIKGVQG